MSDVSGAGSDGIAPKGKGVTGTLLRFVLFACLLGAVGYAGWAAMQTIQARNAEQQTEANTVQSSGLITPTPKVLATEFSDAQGRLLADPPSAPEKLVDPETIVLAHIAGTEENPGTDWKQFEKYLGDAIGRKVVDQAYDNSADQLAEISKGKTTLLALHAADAPFVVNNYGFEPAAVLGSDNGASGNHLDIIVPADSSIEKPADLKGHSLVCTVPASITGYRAAVALLMQNEGLRPNVDYIVTWSMKQKQSVMGVIKGHYDAAAVSDDKLQSLVDDGSIQKTQYKIIYQSEVIPRTTIGWFYNLKPELAQKIQQAILSFRPTEGANAGSDETIDTSLHFIAIDYKKDFALVRLIDASFDPRLDAKTRVREAAAATQPSAG